MRSTFLDTSLAGLVALLVLGCCAGSAHAATTGVYYDGQSNVVAGPNPFNNTTPLPNTFGNIGVGHTMFPHVTTGSYNVAVGTETLASNTTGNFNIAHGWFTMYANLAVRGTSRRATARWGTTPAATTTSRPAAPRCQPTRPGARASRPVPTR